MIMESGQSKNWTNQNPRRRMSLYFASESQRAELENLASAEGAGKFSSWILEKASLGATGKITDERELQRLYADVERLNMEVERERDVVQDYRAQIRELTISVGEYAGIFAKLAQEQSEG
jgi:hypothetical protein